MNETLSQQSRCIAHEIRNHISICELYTQIIKKNLEKDGIKNQSVENALNCINKSLKIMANSLLDLKSLNNLNLQICNIRTVLEEGVKLSTVYTIGKDIKISLHAQENAEVYIDENKFLACIVNIIKNAVEAIENKGEINIYLNFNKDISSNKPQTAIIKISNNGNPIKEPDKIFDVGYTSKKTGCGLGLHICLNNLKAQNADLKLLKSNSDITEFEITLTVKSI